MIYSVLSTAARVFITGILSSPLNAEKHQNTQQDKRKVEEDGQMLLNKSHIELIAKCQIKFKESKEKIDLHKRSIASFKAKNINERWMVKAQYAELLLSNNLTIGSISLRKTKENPFSKNY